MFGDFVGDAVAVYGIGFGVLLIVIALGGV